MQRNELKTIAEGFKTARPPFSPDSDADREAARVYDAWAEAVECVADALKLVDKARSNFLAACGYLHGDEG